MALIYQLVILGDGTIKGKSIIEVDDWFDIIFDICKLLFMIWSSLQIGIIKFIDILLFYIWGWIVFHFGCFGGFDNIGCSLVHLDIIIFIDIGLLCFRVLLHFSHIDILLHFGNIIYLHFGYLHIVLLHFGNISNISILIIGNVWDFV